MDELKGYIDDYKVIKEENTNLMKKSAFIPKATTQVDGNMDQELFKICHAKGHCL